MNACAAESVLAEYAARLRPYGARGLQEFEESAAYENVGAVTCQCTNNPISTKTSLSDSRAESINRLVMRFRYLNRGIMKSPASG